MADAFKNCDGKDGTRQKQNQPKLIAGRPKEFWDRILAEGPAVRKEAPKAAARIGMQRDELEAIVDFFEQNRRDVSDQEQLAVFNKIKWYALAPDDLRAILRASAANRNVLLLEALRTALTDGIYGPASLSGETTAVVLGEAMKHDYAQKDGLYCIRRNYRSDMPSLGAGIVADLLLKALDNPSGNTQMVIEFINDELGCEKPRLGMENLAKALKKLASAKGFGGCSFVVNCIGKDLEREQPRFEAGWCTGILIEAVGRSESREAAMRHVIADCNREVSLLGSRNITEILAEAAKYDEDLVEIIECVHEDAKRGARRIEAGKILEARILKRIAAGNSPNGVLLKYSTQIDLEKIMASIEGHYLQPKKRKKDYGKFDEKWVFPGMIGGQVLGAIGLPIVYATANLYWEYFSMWKKVIAIILMAAGGCMGGGLVGAGVGALTGAVVVPVKAFLQARKDKELSKSWLGWLKKKERENSANQTSPMLGARNSLEILILEHVGMGNLPRVAMLKHVRDIGKKKMKEAIGEHCKAAKRNNLDFSDFGPKWTTPSAVLGSLLGFIGLSVAAPSLLLEWSSVAASLAGLLAGTVAGACVGAVIGVTAVYAKAHLESRKEWKKLKNAWLG